jgi:hypothetical protein
MDGLITEDPITDGLTLDDGLTDEERKEQEDAAWAEHADAQRWIKRLATAEEAAS